MTLVDIDPLKKRIDKEVKEGKILDSWAFFFKAYLDSEPSIDIDRPQGEWIIEIDVNGNTYGRCSICGMRQYAGQLNFCPDCGARMKGAGNETAMS